MSKPVLIYCGGGNKKFYEIATSCGFKYGVQLPDTVYGNLYFADQNWKRPNKNLYMLHLQKHKPTMATVIDWEEESQYKEVMNWAEEVAQHADLVQFIPKLNGCIKRIPRRISGKDVILGYSIPTKYGKTNIPVEDFRNWPIHLLGGSPNAQINTWNKLNKIADVISIDGNYFRMKATKYCESWELTGKWKPDGGATKQDAHYEAFKKSCINIMQYWSNITI